MHESEKARILENLPDDEQLAAFAALGDEAIEVFPFFEVAFQQELLERLPAEQISFILNNLSSDDRTALFAEMDDDEAEAFLQYLHPDAQESTSELLEYPENSIAALIDDSFATVREDMTVLEAMAYLRAHLEDTEAADAFFVVDKDGYLIDDIPTRRLVLSEPQLCIRDIMDGQFVKLTVTDTQEDAIEAFKEYDRIVLPVVDAHNKMLGVVTIDDIVDIAEEEDTKDMQQFGGMESLDLPYVQTPFFELIRKRAGWLIILFLSEMLTASAMGYFQVEIEKAVVLSLFVPLMISSGGNSGSQAATLIIRAMALKELTLRDWWYVMRRELLAGLTLGIILGTVGFIRISIWHAAHWDGSYHYGTHWVLVATTIFFSLIGIVIWGTLSGSMIPFVLKKLRLDPATSSAPFVATLVDVTGLIIYFLVAATLLKGTLL